MKYELIKGSSYEELIDNVNAFIEGRSDITEISFQSDEKRLPHLVNDSEVRYEYVYYALIFINQ